jgi:predicted NUDIX family NTP pyrophosphohydrolase
MPRQSAGLLMYRVRGGRLEVLLVHPGGPFWARKDWAAWSIPKGEYGEGEDPLAAAKREFVEETGFAWAEPLIPLPAARQPSGKRIAAWALGGDCDPARLVSNTFEVEWPPRSGRTQSFPEVDRAAWFDIGEARRRIVKGQVVLLDDLRVAVDAKGRAGRDCAVDRRAE